MKNKSPLLVVFAGLAVISGGCVTVPDRDDGAAQAQAAREKAEISALRADLDSMKERVAGIERNTLEAMQKLEALKGTFSTESRSLHESISAQERVIKASEASHEELRKRIIEDLSTKLEQIMRRQGAPAVTPKGSQGGHSSASNDTKTSKGAGGEYIVKQGDTLTAIAARHGVKASDISQANGLKDGKIRIGQKLVIPE